MILICCDVQYLLCWYQKPNSLHYTPIENRLMVFFHVCFQRVSRICKNSLSYPVKTNDTNKLVVNASSQCLENLLKT